MNKKNKNNPDSVNQPEAVYKKSDFSSTTSDKYYTSEEFWEKVEEKRKNFCSKHGIDKDKNEYITLEEFRVEAKKRAIKLL